MNRDIPALSLREPWCYAVLHLGKPVENRTWATSYRGRIILHAAKTWDHEGEAFIRQHGYQCPREIDLRLTGRLGAYVGEVTVTACSRFDLALHEGSGIWAFGPVCWVLKDPIAYPQPIPGRGYPGLYYPERIGR